jgi:hypothetical protein
MEDRLLVKFGSGADVGWEVRPCAECGKDARFPAGLFRGSAFGAAPAICDECEQVETDRICADLMKRDPVELWEKSGAPKHLPKVRLPEPLRRFLTDDRRGVYLHGDVGVYKSSSATQVIREWCWRVGRPAVYIREGQWFEACWHKDHDTLERIRRAPLLVVDDLGTHHESEFTAGQFFDLVDARYLNQRKTIWISNLAPGDIAGLKHFDDRIMRRLVEMCGAPMDLRREDVEVTR